MPPRRIARVGLLGASLYSSREVTLPTIDEARCWDEPNGSPFARLLSPVVTDKSGTIGILGIPCVDETVALNVPILHFPYYPDIAESTSQAATEPLGIGRRRTEGRRAKAEGGKAEFPGPSPSSLPLARIIQNLGNSWTSAGI
jgi:hypothetical protein